MVRILRRMALHRRTFQDVIASLPIVTASAARSTLCHAFVLSSGTSTLLQADRAPYILRARPQGPVAEELHTKSSRQFSSGCSGEKPVITSCLREASPNHPLQ